jgi:hypothetical protein
MRIVAAIAAFAAGCFHQQALRRPAVNFGATLGHPRPRHRIMPFPESFEPPAFGAGGFFCGKDSPGHEDEGGYRDSVRVPDGPLRGASGKWPLCPCRGSSPGSCVSQSEMGVTRHGLALLPARMSGLTRMNVSELMDPERCRA